MIVDEGEELFLRILFQGDETVPVTDGNYYLGLCNNAIDEAQTLADVVEPKGNGYARQALSRSAAGFPSVVKSGNGFTITSKIVNFRADGGDFDIEVNRLFLCTSETGTAGKLLSYSAAMFTPIKLKQGASIPVSYVVYLQ
jgi:hypothetical protein